MGVSSVSYTSGSGFTNGGKAVSEENAGQLGMSDFFTLLAAQLKYQDPMNPTDNNEFMSQMAQFGMLEQMNNLKQSFNYTIAAGVISKNVEIKSTDSLTGDSKIVKGVVDSVDLNSDTPKCLVNGTWYSIADITKIDSKAATA